MVIPSQIRKAAGLTPGSELEVSYDGLALRLVRVGTGPKLVRKGQRSVIRRQAAPSDLPEVDLASLVDEERER